MAILYYKGKLGVVICEENDRLILVVEESDIVRKTLARLVSKLGFSANTASDASEAVEKASTGVYEVILLDLAMPGVDGYETTRRIRAAEKRTGIRRTPIVAITGHPDLEACLAAGLDDCLKKPIDSEIIESVLERLAARAAAPPVSSKISLSA